MKIEDFAANEELTISGESAGEELQQDRGNEQSEEVRKRDATVTGELE